MSPKRQHHITRRNVVQIGLPTRLREGGIAILNTKRNIIIIAMNPGRFALFTRRDNGSKESTAFCSESHERTLIVQFHARNRFRIGQEEPRTKIRRGPIRKQPNGIRPPWRLCPIRSRIHVSRKITSRQKVRIIGRCHVGLTEEEEIAGRVRNIEPNPCDREPPCIIGGLCIMLGNRILKIAQTESIGLILIQIHIFCHDVAVSQKKRGHRDDTMLIGEWSLRGVRHGIRGIEGTPLERP